MIRLRDILNEVSGKNPKAIILGGGAGSGKTYVTKNLLGKVDDGVFTPYGSSESFTYLNPDDIIEKTGVSLGAAMGEFNKIFTQTSADKQNILWDTTAANVKNTLSKLPGYDKMLVMVYTHPIISILQNAKRDRTLPLEAVIKTWDNVYSNIEVYKNELGDNFVLVQNIIPGYEKEIKDFDNAVKGGKDKLKQYLSDLLSSDPEKFKSSFSKPFEFSSPEIKSSFEESLPQTTFDEKKDSGILKSIKKEFEKEYQKKNENPGPQVLEKKIKSARNTKERNEKNYNENIEGIVNKLTSPQFRQLIEPTSDEEVKSKITSFVNA